MKNVAQKIVLGAMVVAAGVGFNQTNALAGNYTDTPFYFEFKDWSVNSTAQTENREKQDATSSYMKCNYVGGSYTYQGWVEKFDGMDVSGGNKYTFNDNTTHYMINYAYERFGKVNVHIKAKTGFNPVRVAAGGVWSPDSI